MTSIRARMGTDTGGWIEVPELADAAERDRWADAAVQAVERAYGDRFNPASEPLTRRVLAEIAAGREAADLLLLAFLPTAWPLAATARVHLLAPPPLDEWRALGFSLSPIHTAAAGHGMLATRTLDNRVEGQRFVAHQAVFLFVHDGLGVAVTVEPTAAIIFDRMQQGLVEMVGSLTLEYDDGRMFVGERIAELPGTDVDTWNIGEHVPA